MGIMKGNIMSSDNSSSGVLDDRSATLELWSSCSPRFSPSAVFETPFAILGSMPATLPKSSQEGMQFINPQLSSILFGGTMVPNIE